MVSHVKSPHAQQVVLLTTPYRSIVTAYRFQCLQLFSRVPSQNGTFSSHFSHKSHDLAKHASLQLRFSLEKRRRGRKRRKKERKKPFPPRWENTTAECPDRCPTDTRNHHPNQEKKIPRQQAEAHLRGWNIRKRKAPPLFKHVTTPHSRISHAMSKPRAEKIFGRGKTNKSGRKKEQVNHPAKESVLMHRNWSPAPALSISSLRVVQALALLRRAIMIRQAARGCIHRRIRISTLRNIVLVAPIHHPEARIDPILRHMARRPIRAASTCRRSW